MKGPTNSLCLLLSPVLVPVTFAFFALPRLERHPEELHNLALDPHYRGVLRDYRSRLIGELKRTGAPLADNLPEARKRP